MSQLLVDIGNTAIHWAIKPSGQDLEAMRSCDYHDGSVDKILNQQWSGLTGISKVLICSVASEPINSAVNQWLSDHWHLQACFASSVANFNELQNAYSEPETLGADRWAAMVAVFARTQAACCVLDCGTAVTFDVVAENGEHLGGWITPGYRLFRQSLSQETAGITINIASFVADHILGNDTGSCIDIAWHHGVIALVQRTLIDLNLKEIDCFITGGDAKRLLPLLDGKWCYANDLVLQGLAKIAEPEQD